MKFLLFGIGEYYNRYKIWFEKEDIVALMDNAVIKQGERIDGILVISPEDIYKYKFDVVVVMSFYVKEMKAQLMSMGIREDRICHFYDIRELIGRPLMKRKVFYYGMEAVERKREKKILLLNQDLTLGGPALALYHAAQVLMKSGCQVVYGSMLDGSLREILITDGIPVVVDENMLIQTMLESDWIKGYDLIICNTINFHVFLSERKEKIPIAWWLHDALFFYDGVNRKAMEKIDAKNMKIWAVGPIAQNAIKTFRTDFEVENLLYGVEDTNTHTVERKPSGKMRFTVIGYIEVRKGQDILVQAIQRLDQDVREKAEFYFVGQNTSAMAKEIMDIVENIHEILVTGPVDRKEIDALLDKTDILVCPSRDDPMPTVVAEAMMHGIPCIISDAAGTISYLEDEIDSLIFQNENVEQLKNILEKCIMGKVDLKKIGRKSRQVFEKYFSMDVFEKHLIELVQDIKDWENLKIV